uniref:putative nuclease HARBI1 n=1 Tax=Pristiophorus japonicus TaxID=55135 RepID=UPI00398E6078
MEGQTESLISLCRETVEIGRDLIQGFAGLSANWSQFSATWSEFSMNFSNWSSVQTQTARETLEAIHEETIATNALRRALMAAHGAAPQGVVSARSETASTQLACIRRLWFRKEVITELCHLLHTDLEAESDTRTLLSVPVKVTEVLNFYTTRSIQAPVRNICNILQFVVYCCIRQVTDALYSQQIDYIKFSMSMQTQDEHSCGFARIASFPTVQGAIDCTHVALQTPPHNGEVFHNCKGYHSLNVQLVCDHRQMILAVNAHYPDSSHDSFILLESSVPPLLQPLHAGHGWLLSDKGYSLAIWLMTPLCNPTTLAEQRYTHSHTATTTIIEQTIRVLKQRFPCLDRSGGIFQYYPDRMSMFIIVCCMVNSLDIMRGQPLPPRMAAAPQEDKDDEDEDEKHQPQRKQPDTVAAARAACQRRIAHQFQ